jgi:hypothetical protein
MVTVFLKGGLGNQMFQYAAGRGLAQRMNTEVVLDATYLNDRLPRGKEFTYRTYDMDMFTFQPRFTKLSQISSTVPVPGLWLGCDFAAMGLGNVLGIRKLVTEELAGSGSGSGDISGIGHSGVLYGYFQSEKYFENVKDDIRRDFQFRQHLAGDTLKIAEAVSKKNSVMLHVRRGDYLFQKNIDLFSQVKPEYYERALAYVGERVTDPHVFVFSGEPDWCKKNLKIPFDTTYVAYDMAGPKFSHYLELMSLCSYFIATNSSFSWWGAWMSENKEKIIIAPKHWYADPARDRDLIPDSWIKM